MISISNVPNYKRHLVNILHERQNRPQSTLKIANVTKHNAMKTNRGGVGLSIHAF